MTLVNTETGETFEDFTAQFGRALVAPIWEAIGQDDDFILDGLDDRTVTYLRERLAEEPSLRAPLAQAADYRRRRGETPRLPMGTRLVYFIAADAGSLVKIGSAIDPAARLRALQTGSPVHLRLLATEPGGEKRERELHWRFAHLRSHGEWFTAGTDLLRHIATVTR